MNLNCYKLKLSIVWEIWFSREATIVNEWCCDVSRFDHMSEVWDMLKTSLPEFTLPDLASESSVEAMPHLSVVSSQRSTTELMLLWLFSTQQHMCRVRYLLSSVHMSIIRVDQSIMVEVRNMQLSPQSNPTPLVFAPLSLPVIQKFWRVLPERGIKQGWGGVNKLFSSTRYDQSYY